jgi:hypothetical protein
MRTPIAARESAQTALFRRRLVRTADRHVRSWQLALLRTTPRNLYVSRVRALSSLGEESRVPDEGRARKETLAGARSGSHVASARGRSRGRTHGCGDDAGGSRRENVDHEERCLTSRKRCSHASDAEHHREICARCGRTGRDPCADTAIAFALHRIEVWLQGRKPLFDYADCRRKRIMCDMMSFRKSSEARNAGLLFSLLT